MIRAALLAAASFGLLFVLGYPASYCAVHGYAPGGWPEINEPTPLDWLVALSRLNVSMCADVWARMWGARSAAFAGGGEVEVCGAIGVSIALCWIGADLRGLPKTNGALAAALSAGLWGVTLVLAPRGAG